MSFGTYCRIEIYLFSIFYVAKISSCSLFFRMIIWSDLGKDVISTAGMDGSDVIEIVTGTQALALAIDLQGEY